MSYSDHELTITSSVPQRMDIGSGTGFVLNEKSVLAGAVTAKVNGQEYKLRVGQVHYIDFSSIEISSPVTQTISIRISQGSRIDGPGQDSMQVTGQVLSKATQGTAFDPEEDLTIPHNTLTLLCAADSTRKNFIIQRTDLITGPLRFGNALISATRGLKIEMGGILNSDTQAALYAFQNSGSPMTVSRVREA